MNVTLVLVNDDGSTRDIPVGSLPAEIGRGEGCKLRLPLDSVSRKHCRLAVDDDDELVVEDLGSSNGTYVNGEKVRSREVIPGDVLGIGPTVFVVQIDGQPTEINTAQALSMVRPAAAAAPGSIGGVPTWEGQQGQGKQGASGQQPARPTKPAGSLESLDDELDDLLKGLDDSSLD